MGSVSIQLGRVCDLQKSDRTFKRTLTNRISHFEGIEGIKVYPRLQDDIAKVGCLRVILNPGAENPQLKNDLQERGVDVLEACTLVLLKTGQF